MAIQTASKCCTTVMPSFCHLDLLSARSSQVVGSVAIDSRLSFKLSLKRSNGRQLGLVPDGNGGFHFQHGVLLHKSSVVSRAVKCTGLKIEHERYGQMNSMESYH